MLTLFRARLSSPCVAHVNITGRGSTIRKIILLTVARAIGLRYVLHLHDYDYAEYYRSRGTFLKRLIATMFRRAVAVVVLGRRDLEVVSQSLQLSRDRMIVLHNAVPDPSASISIERRARESPVICSFLDTSALEKACRIFCGPSPARR